MTLYCTTNDALYEEDDTRIVMLDGEFHEFAINGMGFRTDSLPVYMSMHIEYTKTSPGCYPFTVLDTSDYKIADNTLSYTQRMSFPSQSPKDQSVSVDYNLSFSPTDIKIKMSIKETHGEDIRYGLVFPVGDANIFYGGKPQDHKVINFLRTWERKWETQDYIDTPVMSINDVSNCVSIGCSIKHNTQFLEHEQNDVKCVKVSTTSNNSQDLEIVIFTHKVYVKESYVQMFPESDSYVNFWKTQIKKIKSLHNISIVMNTEKHDNRSPAAINFGILQHRHIPDAIGILEKEMNRYSGLSKLGILEIVLVEDLTKNGNKLNGYIQNKTIILDASLSSTHLAEALHHEIFHKMFHKLPLDNEQSKWQEYHNVPTSFFEQSDTQEEMSCLYGLMMSDPHFIGRLIRQHEHLEMRCSIIGDIFLAIYEKDMTWKKHNMECTTFKHDPGAQQYLDGDKPQKPQTEPKRLILVCGYLDSGTDIVAQQLFSAPGVAKLEDIANLKNTGTLVYELPLENTQDFINLYNCINCRIIWVVRNPHILAMRLCRHNTVDVEPFFKKWIEVNFEIMKAADANPDSIVVEHENLMLNNIGVMNDISDNMNVRKMEWSKNPVDVDEDELYVDVPQMGNLFEKYRQHQVLIRLQYSEVM